jgi:AraC-like DNA-binding protein
VGDAEIRRFGALPSAAGGITRLAYTRAKTAGADVNLLLKKCGITLAQIENPEMRLKVQDQVNFLNLAARAIEDDLLGLHLALPAELRQLGLLYYIAASSETLSAALQRAARYCSIVNEGIRLKYADDKDVAIAIDYLGVSRHLDRHQIEFSVTALVRLCRQLTAQRLVPSRVRLMHCRDNVSPEFIQFFGANVEFGAAMDEVAFARSIRDLPIVSADPYLHKLLTAYCEEALSRRPANVGSFRTTVEIAIVPLLPHGEARAVEIARHLGVSRRTFARRLSAEGADFSEVLNGLRLHLAERYLADESLSISQIAWLLGYQESSSFTHAFKRWTGKSPRETRRCTLT